MGVISQVADTVAVMYLGRVVEAGTTREVIFSPKHPYTEGLLEAIPTFDNLEERLKPVAGDIPSPLERPSGCPFHTRCPKIKPGLCDVETPPMTHISESHTVSCVLYGR